MWIVVWIVVWAVGWTAWAAEDQFLTTVLDHMPQQLQSHQLQSHTAAYSAVHPVACMPVRTLTCVWGLVATLLHAQSPRTLSMDTSPRTQCWGASDSWCLLLRHL